MAFDNNLIEEILKRADIVSVVSSYINVIKKGRSYVALCPFHDDKNPSLNISKEKQIFKCFVCGQGGNAIQFVSAYEKIPFPAAMKKTAEISGYSDPRLIQATKAIAINPELEPSYKCMSDASDFYRFCLTTEDGSTALTYYDKRGIDDSLRKQFGLGYSLIDGRASIQYLLKKGHSRSLMEQLGIASMTAEPFDRLSGRIIVPIHNDLGRVVGFSGRVIRPSDEAKYINSPESKIFSKGSILYNYYNVKTSARHEGYVYLLEGFMDVIALSKAKVESAVALMGTALSKSHLSLLRHLNVEVRLCLDGDDAGQAATLKMISQLDGAGIKFRIVLNEGEKRDTDEIYQQDGPEKLKTFLLNLVNRVEFALRYYRKTNPLTTTEQRSDLARQIVPLIGNTENELEREDYLKQLSQATSFSIPTLTKLVKSHRENKDKGASEEIFSSFHPEAKVLKRFQLAEREMLYHMLFSELAVDFYKEKIEYFFDEVYRCIANFIIEMTSRQQTPSLMNLLTEIDSCQVDKQQEMIKEITSLAMEKNHPKCSPEILDELQGIILNERQTLYNQQLLERSLLGKDEKEKGRIIAEFNRNKNKPQLPVEKKGGKKDGKTE